MRLLEPIGVESNTQRKGFTMEYTAESITAGIPASELNYTEHVRSVVIGDSLGLFLCQWRKCEGEHAPLTLHYWHNGAWHYTGMAQEWNGRMVKL